MRIVHLTEYFQPKLGYQEYYLASIQQELGHEITVITSDRYFPFPNFERIYKNIYKTRIIKTGYFIEEGIKVIRLPVFFEFSHGSTIFIRNLYKIIKNIHPDIIEVDGVFSILAFQAALLSQQLNIPLVFDTHASTFNTKLNDTPIKKIYYFFFKKIAIPQIKKTARAFLAVGESEKYLLCQEFGLSEDEVTLIPLGADTRLFRKDEMNRRKIRKEIKLASKEILVVYAGKISEEKDINTLLEAVYLLIKKAYPIKLLLIGGGSQNYIEFLEQKIWEFKLQEEVIFYPLIKHTELIKYYSAADIGVWPGNLSNTIIEALACELPIVVPKIVSLSQTSNHLVSYKNGFQFLRGDSKGLSRCLQKLMGEKQRIRMGKNSRMLVIDNFDWQVISKKHLNIYTYILRKY